MDKSAPFTVSVSSPVNVQGGENKVGHFTVVLMSCTTLTMRIADVTRRRY